MSDPFNRFTLNDALAWLARLLIIGLLVIILVEIGHLKEQIVREPVRHVKFEVGQYATIKNYEEKWDVDAPKELPEPIIKEVFKNNKKENRK